MIPKLLHFIRVGDESDRPDKGFDKGIESWRALHPDWTILIWGNSEFEELRWFNKQHMTAMAGHEWNGVAGLMRWEILYANGGIVLDTDSIALRRLDEHLLDCAAFACWANEIAQPGLISARYVGCEPGNPFIKRIVQDIAAAPSVTHDMAWKTVGSMRLTESYREYRYARMRIYPSHYFIPRHFSGLVYDGADPVYSDQLWEPAGKAEAPLHQTSPDTPSENPPQHLLEEIAALYRQAQLPEALNAADALLERYPASEILCNIAGAIHLACGDRDAALALYDRAVAIAPDYAEAHNSRGNILRDAGRMEEALASFDAAISSDPKFAEAHSNRGIVLRTLGRHDAAIVSHDYAVALNPQLGVAQVNRGNTLLDLGRLDEALDAYQSGIALLHDQPTARSGVLHLMAHMCCWSDDMRRANATLARDAATGAIIPPFDMLAMADDPAMQLACAKTWSKARFGSGAPRPTLTETAGRKIRLGYFSADFHNHATMNLMGRMLDLHDRTRFEVHGFSFGAFAHEGTQTHLRQKLDGFHEVAALSDAEIAAQARALGIDVAIDLKGHTLYARPGIFAQRAAPIQINYLGHPGTSGADFIDYILADRIIIPESHRHFYSEDVLYLPHSYQANDDQRPIADRIFSRAELGLPEDGFVFCCFNDTYKITPDLFDIWMRLLDKVPGSVLWLLAANPWAPFNLRREAEKRGIDPARLIFADRMPMTEHLARHRCADLCLDTFNFNAHTTASDALWTGLPIITRPGSAFAARVAASLLTAVGMPDLITQTTQDYEDLALALATDPARLNAIKTRLAANRATAPLFDTARFTLDIEHIYTQLCDTGQQRPALLAAG